jgi:hypothetical protein
VPEETIKELNAEFIRRLDEDDRRLREGWTAATVWAEAIPR